MILVLDISLYNFLLFIKRKWNYTSIKFHTSVLSCLVNISILIIKLLIIYRENLLLVACHVFSLPALYPLFFFSIFFFLLCLPLFHEITHNYAKMFKSEVKLVKRISFFKFIENVWKIYILFWEIFTN